MGTSDYIAPEQAKGEPSGEASDVYSLGVVLFELLTGTVPYEAESPVATAMRHVHDPIPSVRSVRPEVPARLDACVRRALAKEPRDRFASMSDLIAELEACRRGDVPLAHDSAATVIVPPVARQKPHRARRAFRAVVITLLAVAVVVAAAVGAYVLTQGRVERDRHRRRRRLVRRQAGTAQGRHCVRPGRHGSAGRAQRRRAAGNRRQPSDLLDDRGVPRRVDQIGGRRRPGRRRADEGPHHDRHDQHTGFHGRDRGRRCPRAGSFTPVSGSKTIAARTTFALNGSSHRYYVVWITDLGGQQRRARERGEGEELVLEAGPAPVAVERQLDQPVEQLRVRDPRRLEELRVDARRREARDGVQLVDRAPRRRRARSSRRGPCPRSRWRRTRVRRAPGRGRRPRGRGGAGSRAPCRRRRTSRRSRTSPPCATISPGSDATGASLPSTPHSTSTPSTNSSTSTFSSWRNASSMPASSSSGVVAFVIPTDEPSRAGFTNTGKPNGFCDVGRPGAA